MTELWCLVETWQISLIHAITWNPPMTNRDFIDPNWGPPHLFLWLLEGIILFGLYFVCLRYFTHCKMVMDIFWHQWFMLSLFQVMAWCMSGTRARSWTNIKLLSVTLALNVIWFNTLELSNIIACDTMKKGITDFYMFMLLKYHCDAYIICYVTCMLGDYKVILKLKLKKNWCE